MEISKISSNVFTEKNGKIFIGGEEVTDTMRSILRDEAVYLEKSRLWEIFSNTTYNTAIRMALIDSANWEHTLSGKMLYQWQKEFTQIIKKLAH